MSPGQKTLTLSVLWVGIGFTALFAVSRLWLQLTLLGIAIGVTIHVLTLKTISISKEKAT